MRVLCQEWPLALLAAVSVTSKVGAERRISKSVSIQSAVETLMHSLPFLQVGCKHENGLLPAPFAWWQSGAICAQIIEYWAITGDTAFNEVVKEAILLEVGPRRDFMPTSRSRHIGNDDQAWWALTALTAAELKFENPEEDQSQWIELAQAVFKAQMLRWDTQRCAGGLRWQIHPFTIGFDYKNAITNALFFQLAARLARYTGNDEYRHWADTAWRWMTEVRLLDQGYKIRDGWWNVTKHGCSVANEQQWSPNYGAILVGAAYTYNQTDGDDQTEWRTRIESLWRQAARTFYPTAEPTTGEPLSGLVMAEIHCERRRACNLDQSLFKALFSRSLASTLQLAPVLRTSTDIKVKLEGSADVAAQRCIIRENGIDCEDSWISVASEGPGSLGAKLSASAAIQALLVGLMMPSPVTMKTGGLSKTREGRISSAASNAPNITTASTCACSLISAVVILSMFGLARWLLSDRDNDSETDRN